MTRIEIPCPRSVGLPARAAFLLSTLALLGVLAWRPSTADAATWSLTNVDGSGDVGRFSATAVDASGARHVSYWDATNWALKYARRAPNGGWTAETVEHGEPDVSLTGLGTDIAVDAQGRPHISYWSNAEIKYARQNPRGGWTITRIDEVNMLVSTSIAVDGSGVAHITYVNLDYVSGPPEEPIELMYARYLPACGPSGCITREKLDINTAFVHWARRTHALALDTNGRPHVAYLVQNGYAPEFSLRYASKATGSWVFSTLAIGEFRSVALALDGADRPHISYHDQAAGALKYTARTVSGWLTRTIDAQDDAGEYNDIAVTAGGVAGIAYFAAGGEGNLRFASAVLFARCMGLPRGCPLEIDVVDEVPYKQADWFGAWCSVALDAANRPHISYFHGGPFTRNLMYASSPDSVDP
jgi:hypothetical protein